MLPTPVAATYFIFFIVLTILFYLEGLMIAIVATQYWDKETWKQCYPRAYMLHEIVNRPDNVKRFIIGRQFCTVLTGFILAQVTTMHHWKSTGYDPVLFYIVVKSGLIGVLTVLAFGQLMPELLAQEYPLRFMNMPGSYTVSVVCLFFDSVGVGHAAWSFYYFTRGKCSKSLRFTHLYLFPHSGVFCKSIISHGDNHGIKQEIRQVRSAELLVATGSPLGETSVKKNANK